MAETLDRCLDEIAAIKSKGALVTAFGHADMNGPNAPVGVGTDTTMPWTSPIGAAGMGEGYRARDTGHGREVAVKVLADCAIAVTQSVFTIALFLFYWEARHAAAPEAPARPAG